MSMMGLYGGVENMKCERVSFDVSGPFGEQKIEHALIIPKLELPPQNLSLELAKKVKSEEKIDLSRFKNAQICVLVGQDNWPLMMNNGIRRLQNSGLVVSHSALGWSVHGYIEEKQTLTSATNVTCCLGIGAKDENTSLIFGSKSSPCSAIYIKNINAERFLHSMPEAAKSIVENTYMDDYLASGDSIEEMRQRVHEVSLINAEANFFMHGWASNKPSVVRDVCDENQLSMNEHANLCNEEERVLGLYWDRDADTLSFNVGLKKIRPDLLKGRVKPTKRECFSVAMSVYDPLGIIAPFTFQSKSIMQDIWRSGVKWDSRIRDKEVEVWLTWLGNLAAMKKCKIPRCYTLGRFDSAATQLHIFCDASTKAYAAVAYLKTVVNGRINLSLVMSKSRVAPTKPMSVPRLELQAALLGVRMTGIVKTELEIKINERFFWSNSMSVLHWIRGDPRSKQMFVANRLGEIHELAKPTEWRWVPTDLNPADDATRECDKPMLSSDRWLTGPEFLKGDARSWPVPKALKDDEKKEFGELESRREFVGISCTGSFIVPQKWVVPLGLCILGWQRIRKTMERVRTCFRLWLSKIRDKSKRVTRRAAAIARAASGQNETPTQRAYEAEKTWFHIIQAAHFFNELDLLKKGKDIPKGSKLIGLKPYVDDEGLLRARGRVTKLEKTKGVKSEFEVREFENRPIILDAAHYATKLLIAEFHRKYDHANNQTVINELRQQFLIVGLRTRLKWLVRHCVVCRLRRAKPLNPPMADLPASRLAHHQRPFTHCGIDYFGPMHIKIGRRKDKRWGVLFTCMTTRAVHLELAHTLNAGSTIMAIRRLASRRGFPRVMYSDNGTNFVRVDKELKSMIAEMDLDREQETRFAEANRFEWRFNPPDAPHMGGAWDRLVRSVKTALNHSLNDQVPTQEVLLTLLIEIEHMVNSRPLTHVSVDPRDEEALTPNHFLIGSSSGHLRSERYEAALTNPRKSFELAQKLANGFCKRWLREYLPTLLPRQKWHAPTPALKVGDIVLITDYQAPRNLWKTGRVSEIIPNKSDSVV